MEPITIAVHFSKKAFIRLNYFMSYRNPLMLVLTALAFVMAVYACYTFEREKPLKHFFEILIPVLVLVVFPARTWFRSRRNWRKARKVLNVIYRFDNERMYVTGEGLELSYAWKQVHSIREIGAWYMIYLGPDRAHYIPAACFSSSEQENAFRKLVLATGRPAKLKR